MSDRRCELTAMDPRCRESGHFDSGAVMIRHDSPGEGCVSSKSHRVELEVAEKTSSRSAPQDRRVLSSTSLNKIKSLSTNREMHLPDHQVECSE